MICESCNRDHDGKYGSGRFCNATCARSFSSNCKREETNKKLAKNMKGYRFIKGGKVKLCDYGCSQKAKFEMSNGKWCCSKSYNQCPVIKKKNSTGLKLAYKTELRTKRGFSKEAYQKGQQTYRENLQEYYNLLPFIEKPLVEQRRIVLEEQEEKCLICGIEDWNNKSLKLHLDHIDGNNQNQERNNLRYICPNCHSQTDTYCGKNINKIKNKFPVSDKDLIKYYKKSPNISQTLLKVGLVNKGGNYARVKKLIKENNISE